MNEYFVTEQGPEDSLHLSLERNQYVAEAKHHHVVDKQAFVCNNRRIVTICKLDFDLMVAHDEVQGRKVTGLLGFGNTSSISGRGNKSLLVSVFESRYSTHMRLVLFFLETALFARRRNIRQDWLVQSLWSTAASRSLDKLTGDERREFAGACVETAWGCLS